MPGRSAARWETARLTLVFAGLLAGLSAGGGPTRQPVHAAPRWVRHPIADRGVIDVGIDARGTLWARSLAVPDTRWRTVNDRLIGIDAHGKVQARGTIASIVERSHAGVVRAGTVDDVWAVDGAGRAWVGARFHDGSRWTVVGRDEIDPDGATRLEARAIVAADGLAWVPFTTAQACPGADPCDARGLAAFDGRGRRGGLTFEPAYEADAFGLADVHLLKPTADIAPAAVGRMRLYVLPDTIGVAHPLLGPPADPGGLRNAGYAGAASRRADGTLDIFTWVELQAPEGVSHHVFRNRWQPSAGWDVPDDLSASPLFEGQTRNVRPSAAAWSPAVPGEGESPTLWLASSGGGVARWRDGVWDARFEAADIGLPARSRIRDLAVGLDGTLWLAADDGLYSYGELDPIAVAEWRACLPYVAARR